MKILLVAHEPFISIARLPACLARAGIETAAFSPVGDPLSRSRHIATHTALDSADFVGALVRLVETEAPAAIIAGDDRTVLRLLGAWRDTQATPAVRDLIARSFGNPAGLETAASKWQTIEKARELGVDVPSQRRVETLAEAEAFGAQVGPQIILKRENAFGGQGCALSRNAADLPVAFARLLGRFRGAHRAARLLARLPARTVQQLTSRRGGLIAQRWVPGALAFRAVLLDRGKVQAGISAVAETVHPAPFGASSVVRFIDHAGMADATARVARALGLSGFIAADFILEEGSGRAVLIEINPRLTPICHLGAHVGQDLCKAFADTLAGRAVEPPTARSGTRAERVALFPNEWLRDPGSPDILAGARHDIPWDDPPLVELGRRNASWVRRFWRRPFDVPQIIHADGDVA